ncbi:antitoxin Xre/MbcA/ParS toxin-binding domain-containing protein [Pseudomonas sp. NPDC086278]|uniref:antitoxin Xre/MbcA/ParS toxin-binding domain-containing protein n=1 Tax=Pseudomonas sp. NPDC086278 TaxID=3390646 RepID=UPI003D030F1F
MRTDIWAVLRVSSPGTEHHDVPRRQISHSSFQALADLLCLDEKTLGMYLGISAETLVKRAKTGLFSVRESTRLDALIAVVQSAVELFEGDVQAGAVFLCSPSRAFNSKAPLEMLNAGGDARAVIDLIGRLEHGIVV